MAILVVLTVHGHLSGGSLVRVFLHNRNSTHNAIPDTNHNANPTNPNRYSNPNPNPNPTNSRTSEPPDKWTPGQMRGYRLNYTTPIPTEFRDPGIGNSTIPNPGIENSSPGLQSLATTRN